MIVLVLVTRQLDHTLALHSVATPPLPVCNVMHLHASHNSDDHDDQLPPTALTFLQPTPQAAASRLQLPTRRPLGGLWPAGR